MRRSRLLRAYGWNCVGRLAITIGWIGLAERATWRAIRLRRTSQRRFW